MKTILFFVVILTGCAKTPWISYEKIPPIEIKCINREEAIFVANTLAPLLSAIEIIEPKGFSMRNSLPGSFFAIVEPFPYEVAGGHAVVFYQSHFYGQRTLHYFVARDVNGHYVSMGDSPSNPSRDKGVVPRERYIGVVRYVISWPTPKKTRG